MNRALRFLFLAIASAVISTQAFAKGGDSYSTEDITVEYLGSMTRAEFQRKLDATSVEQMGQSLLNSAGSTYTLAEFNQITNEGIDDEDSAMLTFTESTITGSCSPKTNDVYESLVLRNVNYAKRSMDGWLVLTYYSESTGFYHCIFYFILKSK